MFAVSGLLLVSIRSELLHDTAPISIPDAEFVKHLSASAAVQHLLLLQTAFSCRLLHKQRQGFSPIKAKDVVAAVSGSGSIAPAAAAAETVISSSNSSAKQQQYLSVPAHHATVLNLLQVPADTLNLPPGGRNDVSTLTIHLQAALGAVYEILTGVLGQPHGQGMYRVQGLPKIPVELCAPLHCMLAEAVALAPDRIVLLHGVLGTMQVCMMCTSR
jgi:hypothetical protein